VQARHVAARAPREIGVDPAGQHRVHLDVVLRPRRGERASELHQPALARPVRRDERGAEQRHHRADVDDLSAPALEKARIGRLAGDERAGEVGVQHLVPLVERVVLRRLADVDARVVHQDVEPAEALGRLAHHRAARRFLAHVGEDRDRLAVCRQLRQGGGILAGVAACDRYRGAGAGKAERHAQADAAVAAGDQRAFSGKGEGSHRALSIA
jgi:hypothetical protein